MSQLTTRFYQTAESLATTVQAFWKKLNVNQSANFQPTQAKVMALDLADLIDDVSKVY
jgi:hypothetical protein